jgi:hypothetical protein
MPVVAQRYEYRFGFKSAYGEADARFSPGALLLDEQPMRFADDEFFLLFDSRVARENKTAHRIWSGRSHRLELVIARATPVARACLWMLEQSPAPDDAEAASEKGRVSHA